jgi:integrase
MEAVLLRTAPMTDIPQHAARGELRALRRPQRDGPASPFVFVSERGSPFTTAGFARMVERAAAAAGLELKTHPHMLRHACGCRPGLWAGGWFWLTRWPVLVWPAFCRHNRALHRSRIGQICRRLQ